MNVRTGNLDSLRWLIWKENRLVIPLFAAIVGVIAMIVVLQATFRGSSIDSVRNGEYWLALLFPVLMAAGLGLVLVGLEREERTLDWLRTLPIPPRRLMVVKFVVAVGWLTLSWAIAMLFGGLDEISLTRISPNSIVDMIPRSYPFWIAQSLFILIAGFYASCRWESRLAGIAGMVAIAALPAVGNIVFNLFYSQLSAWRATFWFIVVLIPVISTMAYHAAIGLLSPAKNVSRLGASPGWFSGTVANAKTAGPSLAFESTLPALVWQTLQSGRVVITVLISTIVLGTVLPIAFVYFEIDNPVLVGMTALCVFMGVLSVSWLGAGVFQGDGASVRLRFLADRGVSPISVFWARHAPVIALLCTLVILYTLVATWCVAGDTSTRRWTGILLSPLTVVWFGSVVYCVSSWVSQLMRGPVISYLIAPIVSIAVFSWLVACYIEFTTPIWLAMAVGIGVPLVVTLLLMRRFMDGRDRPLSFLVAIAGGATMIVVPLIPAIARVRSIDRMTEPQRTSLHSEASKLVRFAENPVTLSRIGPVTIPKQYRTLEDHRDPKETDGDWDWRPEDALVIEQLPKWAQQLPKEPAQLVPGLVNLIADPAKSATFNDARSFAGAFGEMELAKLDAAVFSGSNSRLNQWIDAASIVAASLRRSTRFSDQETADKIEIWLADTIADESLAKKIDISVVAQSLARLPSIAERGRSRRSAVLAAWWNFLAKSDNKYATFSIDSSLQFQPAALSDWMKFPRAEAIVMILLDAAQQPTQQTWTQQLHRYVSHPSTDFEQSPYGDRIRSLPAMKTLSLSRNSPAQFWGMAWEKDLEELQRRYREQ